MQLQRWPQGPIGSLRQRLVELAVFLLVIAPMLVSSSVASRVAQVPFSVTATTTMLEDVGLTALVLYFVWRNREPYASIGWTLRGAGEEVIVGVAFFLLAEIVIALFEIGLRRLGMSPPPQPLHALVPERRQAVLATMLVFVVAVAEETVFRGYLLLRLREATRSAPAAVVLSAIIFAVGHAYEGLIGVVTVGALGCMLAVVYLWRKSLVAPIAMHFCQDFFAMVHHRA